MVVLRIDRLGRNTTDILNTIKLIHQYKVPITSKNEGITTLIDGKESPMSNLLINILSSLSEFSFHQTKEKALDGIFWVLQSSQTAQSEMTLNNVYPTKTGT